MKYKSYKLDEQIEVSAKALNYSVNEYINHLIRLNEEHRSHFAEQTFNKVEELEKRVDNLGELFAMFADDISNHLNKEKA